MSITMEWKVAETTDPQAMTGDLIEIVRHVAGLLAAFGERLRSGDIIITGSTVPAVAIASKRGTPLRARSGRYDWDQSGWLSVNVHMVCPKNSNLSSNLF